MNYFQHSYESVDDKLMGPNTLIFVYQMFMIRTFQLSEYPHTFGLELHVLSSPMIFKLVSPYKV